MLYAPRFRPAPPKPRPVYELHYLDSAVMLRQMQATGCTVAEMAQAAGVTPQQALDRVALLTLDEGLRACLRREGVPERTAVLLLLLPDPVTRRRVAQRIVAERLCIRDAALLVASARNRIQPVQPSGQHVVKVIRDVRPFRNAIRDIAGQMNAAGVRATFSERRTGGMQELTVSYPARRRRTERHQSI